MAEKKQKVEKICLSTVKSRGWTPALIDELLPEPELVRNPHYRSASEMKLWNLDDVIKAEENEKFKEFYAKKMARKQKAFEKKQKELEFLVKDINIHNPALDYSLARKIDRHFILNIGPTNSGKTYTALQALKKAESGTYLAPLRLLAMEIQDKMLDEGIPCSMVTGEEENIIPGAKLISSTVEMINTNIVYEIGIIDECQMITDEHRGGAWTKAILGLAAETIYLCMSPSAKDICIKLIEMCGDTYEINQCERTTPIKIENPIKRWDIKKNDAIIFFSRRDVLQFADEIKLYGLKASVIYGALPYKSRKKQVDLYNSGETDVIVSTDAIGMGMNLPIKRVVFARNTKYDGYWTRPLLEEEVKQIAGRAGRQGIFDEGFATCFKDLENKRFISKTLNEAPQQIQKAFIPFPEEILKNNPQKTSEIIKKWEEVQYPDMFKKQNMDAISYRVKYIEKKYPELDNAIVFKLSTIMFDDKLETLTIRWKNYVKKFVNNETIEIPTTHATTLQDYEYKYKEMDLYYSFNRTMKLPMDINMIAEEKENIVEKINSFLVIKKKKGENNVNKKSS